MGISKGRIFLKKASSRDLNVVRKKDETIRMPIENKPGRRTAPPNDKGKSGESAPELVRVPVLLTRVQALHLKAVAEERGTTVGQLVRVAVEHYLAGTAILKSGAPTLTREELENLFKDR